MRTTYFLMLLTACTSVGGFISNSRAEDLVQIPKSRLEELERKEKELERLKGDLNRSKDENSQLRKQKEEAVKTSSIEPLTRPVVSHHSQALSALPPVRAETVIESMDIADYYRADLGAADQRFRRQKFRVRGEIVGFEKPMLRRNYQVMLQTPDPALRVVCDFVPPDSIKAVFTAEHGAQLVALQGDIRVILARLGDRVVVDGECRGLSDRSVLFYARQMNAVR